MLGSKEPGLFVPRTAAPFSPQFDTFFFTLQIIGGLCFLLVLILASFVREIQRSPTWYNLGFGWMIFVLSYCMLLFGFAEDISSNQSQSIPEWACVTQSSLIYAAPVLTAHLTTALLCEFWLRTNPNADGEKGSNGLGSRGTVILLVYPHFLWAIVVMVNFQIGIAHEKDIGLLKLGMYCHDQRSSIPARISGLSVTWANSLSLFFLYKTIRAYNRWKHTLGRTHPELRKSYVNLMIRILVLFILETVATILAIAKADDRVVNSYIAILPLGTFLVLGVPRELKVKLLAWCRPKIPDEQAKTPETAPGDVAAMA